VILPFVLVMDLKLYQCIVAGVMSPYLLGEGDNVNTAFLSA
jgi:hypothetical protein